MKIERQKQRTKGMLIGSLSAETPDWDTIYDEQMLLHNKAPPKSVLNALI